MGVDALKRNSCSKWRYVSCGVAESRSPRVARLIFVRKRVREVRVWLAGGLSVQWKRQGWDIEHSNEVTVEE